MLKVSTYAHMTSTNELKGRIEELEADLRYRDDPGADAAGPSPADQPRQAGVASFRYQFVAA